MPRKPTGGKPGRPVSLTRQLNIARVMDLKLKNMRKSAIAAEVGITQREVDELYAEGRRQYVEAPTREAIFEHHAELRGLLEAMKPEAYDGSHLHAMRAMEALDRIAALNGLNAADRKTADKGGSAIDAWLAGSVESGMDQTETADEFLERAGVVEHDSDDLEPETIEGLGERVDEAMGRTRR